MFESFEWLKPDFARLSSRASAQTLHHSLLICGSEGLGKSDFANRLARYLLCSAPNKESPCGECQSCLLNLAGSHPDLHTIESEKQIGVDQIRQAIEKLASKSHISGNRVLVIFAADTMTEASANALLKTLEEPMPGAYLLLVSARPHKLLPTVLSRCEKVQLNPPSQHQLIDFLKQHEVVVNDQMLEMYSSSPLVLLRQLTTTDSVNYTQFEETLAQLKAGQTSLIDLAKQWEAHVDNLFHWMQYWLRCSLRSEYDDSLMALFQRTLEAQRKCSQPGVNKLLQLIGVFEILQTYYQQGEPFVR